MVDIFRNVHFLKISTFIAKLPKSILPKPLIYKFFTGHQVTFSQIGSSQNSYY